VRRPSQAGTETAPQPALGTNQESDLTMDIAARMIAERNRQHSVALTALRMMQCYHDNRYFSFNCISEAERLGWYALAERFVPQTR